MRLFLVFLTLQIKYLLIKQCTGYSQTRLDHFFKVIQGVSKMHVLL
jgi:hypothetical protein